MNTEEAVSLLGSRADFYRQIAQWYFAPLSEEQIEALAAQDLRALAEDDQSSYAEGYNDLYRALRLRHTGTRPGSGRRFHGRVLWRDHGGGEDGATLRVALPLRRRLAYGAAARGGVPRAQTGSPQGARGARLARGPPLFHRGVRGRALRPGCNVSADGDVAAAARTLSDQRAFFDEHIASWFGDFRDRASAMVTTRFYRGVLKVTDAFFNDDRE